MRKHLLALLALVALTFVSACGASGGDDAADDGAETTETTEAPATTEAEETTTTEAESEGVPVEDWAVTFCGDFGDWIDEITEASGGVRDQVTPGDLASAQTAIAGLFESASQSTQDLIDDLEAAGAPDIDDGEGLVADLIERFEAFDEAALTAKADTEALALDPATFEDDANALTESFQAEVDKVGDSFAQLDEDYPSAELSSAISDSCDFL